MDLRVPVDETVDASFGRSCSEIASRGGSRYISGDCSSITCAGKENKDHGLPSSQQQPMAFFRPGTRVRDSLTGEARRLWTKQRPLRVSPPPVAVAALVRPGATVTSKTIVAGDHRAMRVGSRVQLFWGESLLPVFANE